MSFLYVLRGRWSLCLHLAPYCMEDKRAFSAMLETEMWSEYLEMSSDPASGIEIRHDDASGIMICDSGHGMLNRVVQTRPMSMSDLRSAARDAHSRFGRRPYQWWIFTGAGAPNADLFLGEGLVAGPDQLFMSLDLARWICPTPKIAHANLQIREVGAEGRATFMAIVYLANYGVDPRPGQTQAEKEEEQRQYCRLMSGGRHNGWRHFLGEVEGVAVATVSLRGPAAWGAPGDSALHHVAVLPAHQKRGYGRSMLRHALGVAQAAGGSRVVLEASPDGVRLYANEGFTPALRVTVFRSLGR